MIIKKNSKDLDIFTNQSNKIDYALTSLVTM